MPRALLLGAGLLWVILLQPSQGGQICPGHRMEGGPRPAVAQPPSILSEGYRKQQTEAAAGTDLQAPSEGGKHLSLLLLHLSRLLFLLISNFWSLVSDEREAKKETLMDYSLNNVTSGREQTMSTHPALCLRAPGSRGSEGGGNAHTQFCLYSPGPVATSLQAHSLHAPHAVQREEPMERHVSHSLD